MNNQKLKIQKRSNGQYCTAKQFAEDMREHEAFEILQMPPVINIASEAEKNLGVMRKIYPSLTAAFKILLQCEIDKIYVVNGDTPRICVGNKIITTRTGNYNDYQNVDIYLLSVIAEQQRIVDLHNQTEV